MKKHLSLITSGVAALFFGIGGISAALLSARHQDLAVRQEQVTAQLRIAEATDSHADALGMYKAISPIGEAVHLRLLQRQWAMALDIVDQIRLIKFNDALNGEVPALYQSLGALLDEARDRSSFVLTEFPALTDPLAWQIYNIRAAVNLLKAFVVLETEDNWKKVHGTLKEAVGDFKSAIDRVDRTNAPAVEKNIPRWNLELLQGKQDIKKIIFSVPEAERRLDVKENLEAIIPEKGGYAPGDPMERRMKK